MKDSEDSYAIPVEHIMESSSITVVVSTALFHWECEILGIDY